jgi:hypothetical protein
VTTPAQLRPGLWRWTAPHPEWHPTNDDGTPISWPRDVGCVLYESEAAVVFIDPLVPDEDPAAFWDWADERCDGRTVVALETIAYHRRSRDEVIARYGAGTQTPQSLTAHALADFDETVYWIAERRALVPGDVLIGKGGGAISLCPESWLREVSTTPTHAALRAALGPLSRLDVELVLVSHGEPSLRDGAAALAGALLAT